MCSQGFQLNSDNINDDTTIPSMQNGNSFHFQTLNFAVDGGIDGEGPTLIRKG